MWLQRKYCGRRLTKFFHIALSHDSLNNYFQTNFAMMQHHKYSLTELENMLPWEREIYLTMLIKYLEEENEKIKMQQRTKK